MPTYEDYYEITLPKTVGESTHTYHMIGNPYGKATGLQDWNVRVPSTVPATPARIALEPLEIEEWHVGLKLTALEGTARDTYNRAGVVTVGNPDMLRAFDFEPMGSYVPIRIRRTVLMPRMTIVRTDWDHIPGRSP